ncbi:unnamed protein product, partial [Polarella glacialis]
VINTGDREADGVRIISTLPIGPQVHGRRGQHYVDLFKCPSTGLWRSLAVPLLTCLKRQSSERAGAEVKVWTSVAWNNASSQSAAWFEGWSSGNKKWQKHAKQEVREIGPWEDLSWPIVMKAPQAGVVLVTH